MNKTNQTNSNKELPFNNFYDLSYSKQKAHLNTLAQIALTNYELGNFHFKLIQYEDNAVYFVQTENKKKYVLRISTPTEKGGHTFSQQKSEIEWLLSLKQESDLIVPNPVKSFSGNYVITVEDTQFVPKFRNVVLFEWISGKSLGEEITPLNAEHLGKIIAKLHNNSESYSCKQEIDRPSWDWGKIFGARSVFNSEHITEKLSKEEIEIFDKVSLIIKEDLLQKDASNFGLIHSDLHRGNIVIDSNNLGVIDFDDCGFGYFMMDIATILSSILRISKNEADYLQFKKHLLYGYNTTRYTGDINIRELATFLVMRDMVIVNFILGTNNAEVLSWGGKRLKGIIQEMEKFSKTFRYPGV